MSSWKHVRLEFLLHYLLIPAVSDTSWTTLSGRTRAATGWSHSQKCWGWKTTLEVPGKSHLLKAGSMTIDSLRSAKAFSLGTVFSDTNEKKAKFCIYLWRSPFFSEYCLIPQLVSKHLSPRNRYWRIEKTNTGIRKAFMQSSTEHTYSSNTRDELMRY